MSDNEFELNDLSDFYSDELGAQDWNYQGQGVVKVLFQQIEGDFVAYVQASEFTTNPILFDQMIDPHGKTWWVKAGFEKERYDEYRIHVTDEPPLLGTLQSPSYSNEDDAGFQISYTDVETISLFVDPFDGDTTVFDEKAENFTKHMVKILWRSAINANYRFKIGTRALYIQNVINPNSFKKELVLACYELEQDVAESGAALPGIPLCGTDICNNSTVTGANVTNALDALNAVSQYSQTVEENINEVLPVFLALDSEDSSSIFIENTSDILKTVLVTGNYLVSLHTYAEKQNNNTVDLCADLFINGVASTKMQCSDECGPVSRPGCTLSSHDRIFALVKDDTLQFGCFRLGGNNGDVLTIPGSTFMTIKKRA